MFDIGGGELILIVIAFVVLFGPKKIPEISRMLGKGLREIKKTQTELKTQLNELEKEIEEIDDIKK
ncbi:Sec-independent protein translocase protein TatB [bioreactor metagenome]|uniref:Sec-independent protein translocase protein TatB n=1 Tax=bioreactor metagenome TaxID=1076179 RepID=A0A645F237_9ZZZZ